MDRLPISPAGGGRALLAKFVAPPNIVTTSQPIAIPSNTQGLVVAWREITTFQISPVTVTVQDGTLIWGQFSIGFNATTNVKASVLTVPIAPEISSTVTVVIDEGGTSATHEISVIGVADNIFRTTLLSGSGVVTPTNLTSVGTTYQPLFTTFGEVGVAGAGGQTILSNTVTNAINTIPLAGGPFFWHVQSITASLNGKPVTPVKVTCTTGFGQTWSAYVDSTGPTGTGSHWPFPDGGLSFPLFETVTITATAGGAGVSSILSVQAANRNYGP